MTKRWLIGAAILALAPVWVPLLLPIIVADLLRREWEASIWEQKRRRLTDERE